MVLKMAVFVTFRQTPVCHLQSVVPSVDSAVMVCAGRVSCMSLVSVDGMTYCYWCAAGRSTHCLVRLRIIGPLYVCHEFLLELLCVLVV